MNVPITSIAFQSNVRSKIDKKEDSFKELTKDIDRNGLIQPLVVYNKDNKYYLIAGHRRLAALQELNAKEVPIFERPEPNGDFTKLQLSENTMRKDLTLYEEIMAFKSMTTSNMTISEVADKFGHSRNYVVRRVELGNLIPQLLKADTFDNISSNYLSSLRKFAKHHKHIQKDALEWVAKKSNMSTKEYYEEEFLGEDFSIFHYPGLKQNKVERETLVELCDTEFGKDKYGDEPEERFKKLQKAYGYNVKKVPTLFQDEEFADYCSDVDFFKFIWTEIYPKDAYDSFHSLKIDKELLPWSDNCSRGVMPMFLRYLYLRECCGQALQKPKVVAWNGDWDDPIIKTASKVKSSSSKKTETVERTQYYLQTKKFGKAIATDYLNYLKDQIFNSQKKGCPPLFNVGLNSSHIEKWLIEYGTNLNSISVGEHQYGYNLSKIRDNLNKDYTVDDLQKEVYKCLVFESLNCASFKMMDKLARKLELLTLKEWFKETWETTNDKEFISDVLNAFNTTNLQKITTGKKKEIIELACNKKPKFPFLNIFSSKEAEWNDLSLKFAYLDKAKLYVD